MVLDPPPHPQRRHPRLPGYDYRTPGYYFVTICTQHRLPLFGAIEAGEMVLSPAGEMVHEAWHDLLVRHPGVGIDTQVAMPDHVHAIVILEDDPRRRLSVPEVLQRYKALTTRRYAHGVREHGWPRFEGRLWQEGYHDHVIRQDEELDAVRRYILENPLRWELRPGEREQARER